MEFEWNRDKDEANLLKHGVSFDEAKSVFDDPLYIDFYDPDHSDAEERYILLGQSRQSRLLVVSYIERGHILNAVIKYHSEKETRDWRLEMDQSPISSLQSPGKCYFMAFTSIALA